LTHKTSQDKILIMASAGKKAVNIVLHTISIVLLAIIGTLLVQSSNSSDIDLSAIEQYKDDWTQNTFTKIDVDHNARQYDMCKSGYTPVFSAMWPGSTQACDCRGEWQIDYYRRKMQFDSSCYDDERYYCDNIRALPAVELKVIEGNIICGKNKGPSFMNIVRPDPKTKKC